MSEAYGKIVRNRNGSLITTTRRIKRLMNIVLHEPGIALNTGNIGRTCAATLTSLHLIRPYGFRITEKEIKRAGMDYWEKIDLHEYIDYEDFLEKHPEITFNCASSETTDAAAASVNAAAAGTCTETDAVQNTLSGRDTEPCDSGASDTGTTAAAGKSASTTFNETDTLLSDTGSEQHDCSASDEAAGPAPKLWFATTKARQSYSDVSFGPNDYIMLGNESRGIPEEILVQHPDACIRIPMWGDIRSLNLANSAAIILYEALRQNDFENMERCGHLHRLSWG